MSNPDNNRIKDADPTNNQMDLILQRLSLKSNKRPISDEINPLAKGSGYKELNHIYDGRMDSSLQNQIGNNIYIQRNKLLGRGSYSDVVLAVDENNNQFAVKCCKIDKDGIPNILEASIMGTTVHPYLNRAVRIDASDTYLYITQELALTDLAHHTRKDKGGYTPSLDQLRYWCFCLCHAVSALHVENIIHADIKANNVLLYPDGSIRLTDYTLATKKRNPTSMFKFNVCTCTHRPLECLTRRYWNESLDIWSLGCTLYEIAYGQLLFEYQGLLEEKINMEDKEFKKRVKYRSTNAIIDWAQKGPNPVTPYEVIRMHHFDIQYLPFKLCDEFYNPEMAEFNKLMCKMLMVDPKQRPTIGQIISDPFFKGYRSPLYLSIRRPQNKITVTEQARVTQYIYRYSPDPVIRNLAINIYCRCNDLDIREHIKAATCAWIACKIIDNSTPPALESLRYQILSAEREICQNLMFRLHSF